MPYVCRNCCCKSTSDDFNRSDDTNLGTKWNEVSGSWSISSNRLVTTDTSALCIATAAFTATGINARCLVRGGTNDVVRLVFACADSSNFWYAQLTIGSSKTLLIVQVTGGTHTTRATNPVTTSASTDYTIYACVSDIGRVHAEVLNGSGLQLTACDYTNTSNIPDVGAVGVGTGATAASVQFDDFYAKKSSPQCDVCVPACTECAGDIAPTFWDVELPTNMDGTGPLFNWGCNDASCTNMGGVVFRLPFWAITVASINYCGWALDITDHCVRSAPTYPPTDYRYWLAVLHGGASGTRIYLTAGGPNAIHPEPSTIWNSWEGTGDCTSMITCTYRTGAFGTMNGGVCLPPDPFDPTTMGDAYATPVF